MNPVITTQLARIQTDPNSSADPIATAFFETKLSIDGKLYSDDKGWSSVTWRLGDTTQTVMVGEKELTYAEVSAGVVAIAYAQKVLADNPPVKETLIEEDPNAESPVEVVSPAAPAV
jgi:hypothetical protein